MKSFKQIFEDVQDWYEDFDGADIVEAVTVGVGAIAIIASAVLLPLDYFNQQKVSKLKSDFFKLDHTKTVIFKNIKDCESKGYSKSACNISWTNMAAIANDEVTSVSYDTELECQKNHLLYGRKSEETVDIATVSTVSPSGSVGTGTAITTGNKIVFAPKVLGWLASKGDISLAAPLYSGLEKNSAVRNDGKKYTIDN